MSRKSFVLAIAIIISLVGFLGATGYVLVRHEPSFYKRCNLPSSNPRKHLADELEKEISNQLVNGIINETSWEVHCTETEINAFLAEGLLKNYAADSPWPDELSDPRLGLENGLIHFGFRYGVGRFSTVVSLELRPWLAVQDPNVLVLEFVSLHAGAIPISSQWLMERIAQAGRPLKIDVSYFRYNNHPTLVLRFQSDHSAPTFQLGEVKVTGQVDDNPGFVHISGRPSEKPKG
ncbi:hypothetical protein BH10PLA2_BH10PLA2_04340 [soil metagenome]